MATASTSHVKLIIGGQILGSLTGGLTRLAKQLDGLGGVALRAGGALASLFAVQRMVSFTAAAIASADAIGKLAEKTGISVEAMGQLAFAMEQDDIEVEALQASMKGLSQWMVRTAQDSKPLEEALLEQADAFAVMEDGADKINKAVAVFGKAGPNMIPFLNKGSDAIRDMMDEAKRLGSVTAAQAKSADEWGDAMGRLTLAAKGFALSLTGPVIDALKPITDALAESAAAIGKVIRESDAIQYMILVWAAFATVVAGFGVSALAAAAAVKYLTAALSPLLTAFAVIGAALTGATLGLFISQIEVLGKTIEEHITKALLEAEKAWVQFWLAVGALGMSSVEELVKLYERLQEIQQAIDTLSEDFNKGPKYDATGAAKAAKEALDAEEKLNELRRERVAYEIASLELGIRQANNDEERRELMTAQYILADQLVTSAQLRLEAAREANMEGEEYLKLEQAVLKAESDRQEIVEHINALNEKERQRQKAKVDAAQAAVSNTYAGRAADQFSDFKNQQQTEKDMASVTGGTAAGMGAVAGLQTAMAQLGTMAQQIGNAISTVIGGAVDGIANSIEGLIKGTMTWKDALLAVGDAILTSIIGALAQMAAQMLVSFLMQLFFSKLMETQAASLSATWAEAAFFAAVATEGSAVAVGMAALLAGRASVMAMSAPLMGPGFATGGYTGAGPMNRPAGIVHAGEYVVPAKTVNAIGVPYLDALVAGQEGMSTAPKTLNQNIHMHFDKRAWLQATRDDIESIAVDVLRRNSWRGQLA